MQGSEESTGRTPEDVRARQERDIAVSFALATMEYALANEAFHVGSTMRDAGIGFDPLTFVALRILEAGAAESVDPSDLLATLADNGTLERSVELAEDWLEDEAA
jgi:hypothetical protein